jgi:hypothetical protein
MFKGEKHREAQQKFWNLFANCLDDLEVDFDHFLPPTDTAPPPVGLSDGQKILWELSELNFRFELLALDKWASGTTNEVAAEDRQDMICQCFPNNTFIAELPHATQGPASQNWQERLPVLLRLRALMQDWQGLKPTPLLLPDLDTQTFFNFFGRAAVIPTRLDID